MELLQAQRPSKNTFLRFIFLYVIITNVANILVVIYMNLGVSPIYMPPAILEAANLHGASGLYDTFEEEPILFLLPFISMTILALWHFLKMWIFLNPKSDEQRYRKGQRMILNLPVTMGMVGFGGWLVAVVMSGIYYMNAPEALQILHKHYILLDFILGDIVFIFTFYLIEFLNQKKVIPLYFPDNKLSDIEGVIHFSSKIRFGMLSNVAFLMPMLVIVSSFVAQMRFVSPMEGTEIFNKMLALILPLVAIVTMTFAFAGSYYGKNIRKTHNAAKKIKKGIFDIKIPVNSTGEIGELAEMMNEMAGALKEREALTIERNELKNRNELLEQELALARRIQMKFIPQKSPREQIAFYYKPMYQVGGDFFHFIPFSKDKMGLLISDVSGHGIPAAFVTAMIHSFTVQFARELTQPAEFLTRLNDFLIGQTDGNFVTAFYGIYDFKDRRLSYANAGHNPPYLIGEDGAALLSIEKSGMALAAFTTDELKLFGKGYTDCETSLPSSCKVLFYTDGLTEAIPEEEKMALPDGEIADFESVRLPGLLPALGALGVTEGLDRVITELTDFHGNTEFEDDVCVILLDAS